MTSDNIIDFQFEKNRRDVIQNTAPCCLDTHDLVLELSDLVVDDSDLIQVTEDAIIISMGDTEES